MSDEGAKFFEYIVVGCGGIGSGAVYWLSKRSTSVLGLEQFKLGHVNGGSQDYSRMIRLTYQDERYTRLAPDAFKTWRQIEKESGLQVFYKTGSLQLAEIGKSDFIINEYTKAMDRAGIKYEYLSNTDVMRRYPQFTVGPDIVALYQDMAGFVDAALGNSIHIQLARGNGATILEECAVTRLTRAVNGNIVVHTTNGKFECRRLIVAAGAWLNHVIGTIGVHVPVTVTQEQVTYLGTPHMKDFTKDKYPIWLYHHRDNDFYSMPIYGNSALKIGIDVGGPSVTVNTRTFIPDPEREKKCIDLLKKILPKAVGPIVETKTCLYTMPPDRNFVIDTCSHKGWPDVSVCCGAGHAYKFASLLGKILTELAVDGHTHYNIEEFGIQRDALTDPSFKPAFHMGDSVTEKR